MKKEKRFAVAKEGIVMLQKRFVPAIKLKRNFSKKLIKNIPSAVILAHLSCNHGSEVSPLQDPLFFLIPMFAKNPSLATAQLVDAIGEYMCDYDFNPTLGNDGLDEFMSLLQSMD